MTLHDTRTAGRWTEKRAPAWDKTVPHLAGSDRGNPAKGMSQSSGGLASECGSSPPKLGFRCCRLCIHSDGNRARDHGDCLRGCLPELRTSARRSEPLLGLDTGSCFFCDDWACTEGVRAASCIYFGGECSCRCRQASRVSVGLIPPCWDSLPHQIRVVTCRHDGCVCSPPTAASDTGLSVWLLGLRAISDPWSDSITSRSSMQVLAIGASCHNHCTPAI